MAYLAMFHTSIIIAFAGSITLTNAAATRGGSVLNWTHCDFIGETAPVKHECSNFTVPLDYLDTSTNRTLTLQVARIPAVNGKSRGSIFFNFGGPGFGTRQDLVSGAEELLVMTGGNYDLIGLDPRGTADTSPFKCYGDAERRTIVPKHRVNDAYGPKDKTALARMWASTGNIAVDCLASDENAPEMGELIGTGYTARDMMRLNDALEGPESMLNYWGTSYGTILGATTAALFPERMGRVLLTANINIPEWFDGYDIVWWSDADKAVLDYFERCVQAGPDLCALAGRGEPADLLNDRLYALIDELRRNPIPVGDAVVLDASGLKMALRSALYGNPLWPTFGVIFHELFKPADERNLTIVSALWRFVAGATEIIGNLPDESMFGIYCGDKTTRAATFEDIFPVSEALAETSRALGEVANNLVYLCARWPYHAKGGYAGDWTGPIRTANPLLFAGSRYDAVTPISNAYNGSRVFPGSGVLVHGGIGHGVTAHPSLCTARAIRAYFQDGTLPAEDVNCTADFDAFDTTKTWRDSYLPELGWEGK